MRRTRTKNDRNRLSVVDSRSPRPQGHTQAAYEKFSDSGHVRVEKAYPDPCYNTWTRTKEGTTEDASPNEGSGVSDAQTWEMNGYAGISGYLLFAGGTTPSADLEVWAKDEENNVWMKAAAVLGLSSYDEFFFPSAVRSRKIFLRLRNIQGTPTSIAVRVTPV